MLDSLLQEVFIFSTTPNCKLGSVGGGGVRGLRANLEKALGDREASPHLGRRHDHGVLQHLPRWRRQRTRRRRKIRKGRSTRKGVRTPP